MKQRDLNVKSLSLLCSCLREQRAAYLDQACGDNKELREEVESLVNAHDTSNSFMERPALELPADGYEGTTDYQPLAERPGTIIGSYKLLQQIGEGGHRRGVHGRAGASRSAPRGTQDHQAGHGHAAGDRPLRGRAASPGDDGPSEYRQACSMPAPPNTAAPTS